MQVSTRACISGMLVIIVMATLTVYRERIWSLDTWASSVDADLGSEPCSPAMGRGADEIVARMLQRETSITSLLTTSALRELVVEMTQLLAGCSLAAVPLVTLYVVTGTYRRAEQLPEIVRLGQTLMQVPNLVWIVSEEGDKLNPLITQFLVQTGMRFEHITAPLSEEYKKKKSNSYGLHVKLRGLAWIRANASASGVMYLADDDNTYDLRIFEEMRSTKRVSAWPVGLVNKSFSSPIVLTNGSFAGFQTAWSGDRKFRVDQAGFAINVGFLLKRPAATILDREGYHEDSLLSSLAPFEPHELELKADNCTKIFVWHTQTVENKLEPLDIAKLKNTNIKHLKKQMEL